MWLCQNIVYVISLFKESIIRRTQNIQVEKARPQRIPFFKVGARNVLTAILCCKQWSNIAFPSIEIDLFGSRENGTTK